MTAPIRLVCRAVAALLLLAGSLYRDQWPGVAIVSTPATQFEHTRPDSLYDDLTEMNKYMPMLEQALASGKGASGKPLSDAERTYYIEVLTETKFMQPELKQTPKAPTSHRDL